MNNQKKVLVALACGIAMMGVAILCVHYLMQYNTGGMPFISNPNDSVPSSGTEEIGDTVQHVGEWDGLSDLNVDTTEVKACFLLEKPIDLSDLVECGDMVSIVGRDTDAEIAKAKRVSQYVTSVPHGGSDNRFLDVAQDYYNGYAIIHDLETNLGDWMVGKGDEENANLKNRAVRKISSVNVGVLKDEHMKKQAQQLRDGFAHLIRIDEVQGEKYVDEVLNKRMEALLGTLDNRIALQDMADSILWIAIQRKATLMVKNTYAQCKAKKEAEQMDAALHALNDCKNFDEQCAFLLLLARNEEDIIGYDECVMAIAERMMKSGEYSPLLYHVWMVWRSLYQIYNCGMSVYSEIPNELYNEYRKSCYLSCLQYLHQHPNDKIALTQAILLAAKSNVLRYGELVIGNSVAKDYMEYFNM